MKTLVRMVRGFDGREARLETVEYAVIAGLIAVFAIALMASIGVWVSGKFAAFQAALGQ